MNSAQEHRDILDALLAGDGAAVESLMHTHLRYLRWSGWSSPDLSPSRSEFRASHDPAALHDGQPRGRLRERRSELERVFREQQCIAVAPEVE